MSDTIVALSSGAPPAAIAVIRVSGPAASAAVAALAGPLPVARMATYRVLRGGDGVVLDRALVLWFPGPASATGEDLAEFHCHGGRAVVRAVEDAILSVDGVRRATGGEFTRRALRNGRIDRHQAEGLADLLSAETEAARRLAVGALGGEARRRFDRWAAAATDIWATLEAAIDYVDEDDVLTQGADVSAAVAALRGEIEAWLAAPSVDRLRTGVTVVVAGPPNSGKSSLVNALAERDVAIESDIAGTTRDAIEVPVAIGGVPVVIVDTAGLTDDTDDPIERVGIERARALQSSADIVLWMGDDPPTAPSWWWLNPKCDLPGRASVRERRDVSVFEPTTVRSLQAYIGEEANRALSVGASGPSEHGRGVGNQVIIALAEIGDGADPAVSAAAARRAANLLSSACARASDEMLDRLFARFCVGK